MIGKGRYIRAGSCNQCGWCCLQEDPPCPHLLGDKPGEYKCAVYDKPEERPVFCAMYPSAPPIVHKECGYWFVDTLDDDKIITNKVS